MADSAPLDLLDRRILYQLDLDCRQSIPALAKKVGAKKDTVRFRLARLLKEKVITRFITEVNTAKFGYIGFKVYFQMQDFGREQEKEFFDYLLSFPQTGWVVRCSGRWDVLLVYWGRSSFEFHRDFEKIFSRFSRHIIHKEVAQNVAWFWYNRKWLVGEEAHAVGFEHGGPPEKFDLDLLDKRILSLLIEDGRKPVVDIARTAGTGPQNVLNRIRRLKKAGVISRFSIDIDYKRLGLVFCKAFIYLQNISPKRLEELYAYCRRQPHVFALVLLLGPWDLELEFEAHDFEEMMRIMDDLRQKFGDIIRNYESVMVSRQTTVRHIGE